MRVQSWGSLPQSKFCKNDLKGYTPLGKIYTKKLPFLVIFWAVVEFYLYQTVSTVLIYLFKPESNK